MLRTGRCVSGQSDRRKSAISRRNIAAASSANQRGRAVNIFFKSLLPSVCDRSSASVTQVGTAPAIMPCRNRRKEHGNAGNEEYGGNGETGVRVRDD